MMLSIVQAALRAGRLSVTAGVGAGFGAVTSVYDRASRLEGATHTAEPIADRGRVAGVFDGRLGFGKKAAVVVVDFVNAYVDPSSKLYCGDPEIGVVSAVQATRPLLQLARAKGVDIIFTKVLYHGHGKDGGVFVQKVPLLRTFTADNPLTEVVSGLEEPGTDTVIVKKYPSAFFGTELAALLTASGIDTIILVGCSTSGCIRATALDAMQHGFRCIVPRECVGDRTRAVHESNLYDINSKNGDVMSTNEVMDILCRLP